MKESIAEKIIIKSMNIFSKKSSNATIEDIAKCCKVSTGSIYYYFKDKNELYFEAVYYAAKKVNEVISNALDPSKDTETNYKNAILAIIDFSKKNVKIANFFCTFQNMHHVSTLKEREYAKIAEFCSMQDFLKRGVEKGDILDIPLVITVAYFPVYSYVILNNKLQPTTSEQDKMFADSLWRAIASDKKRAL
jgi:AcrR family transcriptional regulator